MNDRLMFNAPTETIGIAQTNGWMDSSVFLTWLKHFVKYTQPTESQPVLLILDGHGSHKDLQVILYARENYIHMLSTPPHCTHKIQPLDRTFMKPFKTSYNEACSMWMRTHPGARIGQYDIAGLVAQAFSQTARLDIAEKGFQCTGIYPLNRNIFTDLDFLPSMVTDISDATMNTSDEEVIHHEPKENPSSRNDEINVVVEVHNEPVQVLDNHATTDAFPKTCQNSLATPHCTDTEGVIKILQEISPVPNCSKKRLDSRKRKAEKSEILTSTPFKDALEEKVEAQRIKEAKKVTKKINFNDTKKKNKITKATEKNKENLEKREDKGKENYACIICSETFDEDWIKCDKCQQWAHEECADIEMGSPYYTCDYCKMAC